MPEEPLDEELLREVGDELVRFARRRLVSPAGATLDLSAFRLLHLLVESGPRATINDLGVELELDQSTVSRQVAAAVRRGLVERTDADGARVLRPTTAGAEAYAHDLEIRSALYRSALTELGADRVTVLLGSLREFLDALDRATGAG